VMNVRSWFIYLIQRKRSVRTSNKVVPIKMLLHRRLLKGHGLYSSCYEVLIFLLLVSSDHKVYCIYTYCRVPQCMSPHWHWDPSIPSPARYPFISITHSKPLMSSGSWLTPVTSDIIFIIFIRVNERGPWPRKRGLQLISKPNYLTGSLFTPQLYPTILAEVTIYPARFMLCFGFCQCHYSH
jgi:hypothetical protein